MDQYGYDAPIKINMWYGNKLEDVDEITCDYRWSDWTYIGDILIAGKIVGNYSTKDYKLVEKTFMRIIVA